MGQLRTVNISTIVENPVALRTVNRQSEAYLGLVASIGSKGFLGAITVRPKTDDEGTEYFELVDGLHRFSAAKDAGLTEIQVDVTNLEDDEVLEAQIMTNIHKVETRPIEYSNALKKLLVRNPLMTEAELASRLGKSASWISGRLGLNKITSDTVRTLIDEGKIKLSNAYALAKLPPEEQGDWADRAMTLGSDEFIPQVTARVKQLREDRRKGLGEQPSEFQPVAFLQKLADLKSECTSGQFGTVLCQKHSASTAQEGFALAIQWALHLDPESVAAQQEKEDARRSQREAKKAERKAKREVAKAETLAKKHAEAVAVADAATAEVASA